jgi:hypothetical protein
VDQTSFVPIPDSLFLNLESEVKQELLINIGEEV